MDAFTCLQSSGRVHTSIALTALAFFSFIVILSYGSETQSIVHHTRRDVLLLARQEPPSSSSFVTEVVSTTSGVSTSTSTDSSTTLTSTSSSATIENTSSTSSVTSTNSTSSSTSSITTSTSSSSTSPSTTTSTRSSSTSTSSTRSSSIFDPLAVTIIPGPNVILPSTTETSSTQPSTTESSGSTSESAASSGFWGNKAAVTATFVIVALIIAAIFAAGLITILKRRNARKHTRLLDETAESYRSAEFRSASPGPSVLTSPMDAFARNEVTYDNMPNAARSQRAFILSSPVQHPDFYNTPATRYAPPSQLQPSTGARPPSAYRNPDATARDSTGYQPSIDSFYGAGQPSGRA